MKGRISAIVNRILADPKAREQLRRASLAPDGSVKIEFEGVTYIAKRPLTPR
jgi:hypothetical protein